MQPTKYGNNGSSSTYLCRRGEMILNHCVLTPNQIISVFRSDKDHLCTNSDQIGVLPNHDPITTMVDIGLWRYTATSS